MSKPKIPENAFVYKRYTFAVVKWNPVIKDINNNLITIDKYLLYRAELTNLEDLTKIADIDTLDANGKVDTCYLDMDAFGNALYFYKLKAVLGSDESDFSNEAVNLHFLDLRDIVGETELDKFARWDLSKYDLSYFA